MVEQLLSMYKTPGSISSKKEKKKNKYHPGLQRQFQDSQNYTEKLCLQKPKKKKKRKKKGVEFLYFTKKWYIGNNFKIGISTGNLQNQL